MTIFWQVFPQKPDRCARQPEIWAGYIVLITLDFSARTLALNVCICPGGPWRKAEATTFASLPDLPAFLRNEG